MCSWIRGVCGLSEERVENLEEGGAMSLDICPKCKRGGLEDPHTGETRYCLWMECDYQDYTPTLEERIESLEGHVGALKMQVAILLSQLSPNKGSAHG